MRAITSTQSELIASEIVEQARQIRDRADRLNPPWGEIYLTRFNRLLRERMRTALFGAAPGHGKAV